MVREELRVKSYELRVINMKKGIIVFMTVVLAVMMAGCAATYIDSSQGHDGSSFQKAVIVGSVRSEYLYIDHTYKGSNILSQMVTNNNGSPFDVVTIMTKEGEQKDVYFDISKFYRKKTYADDLE
jgi:uncharacterized lipoprotein YehR (DUF1307 family)